MSERKWTKGPWLVDPQNSTGVIAQHEIDTPDSGGICCCNGVFWQRPLSECDANAHLIAAAPDLFEALEAFVEFAVSELIEEGCRGKSDPGCPSCMAIEIVDRARSALSRARGEGT